MPKFKIGDKVRIIETQTIAEVMYIEVANSNPPWRYVVEFKEHDHVHRWLMTQGELELVENALQRLKRRYAN